MGSFKKQLKKYTDKVNKWDREIIRRNKYDKEQNTVVKFIIPLFEILGWGPLYKDMEFEYAVHKKRKNLGRADIALYPSDSKKPKILVEVKPLKTKKLGKGSQLFKYLKAENINYGIYTNGRTIRLIDKRYTRPSCAPHTLFTIDLKDFYKYRKALRILSKQSVKSGKLDRLAKAYDSKEYKGKWNDYHDRLKFADRF